MQRLFTLVILTLSLSTLVHAQSFLEHIQQTAKGKGTVVVTESKQIDELVNGSNRSKGAVVKKDSVGGSAKTGTAPNGTVKPTQRPVTQPDNRETPQGSRVPRESVNDKPTTTKRPVEGAVTKERTEVSSTAETRPEGEEEVVTPAVDMSKKVMLGSRKIAGFRVQAFAGGNTRNDKERARQIGSVIKMKYPELPVYVHFYSPRWICRVGNFRSYDEAAAVLAKVKSMGFKTATIVKGRITVPEY